MEGSSLCSLADAAPADAAVLVGAPAAVPADALVDAPADAARIAAYLPCRLFLTRLSTPVTPLTLPCLRKKAPAPAAAAAKTASLPPFGAAYILFSTHIKPYGIIPQ